MVAAANVKKFAAVQIQSAMRVRLARTVASERRAMKVAEMAAVRIQSAEKLHDKMDGKERGVRWRGPREYAIRYWLVWFLAALTYTFFCLVAAVYGVVKFKGAATNYMLATWGVAAVREPHRHSEPHHPCIAPMESALSSLLAPLARL